MPVFAQASFCPRGKQSSVGRRWAAYTPGVADLTYRFSRPELLELALTHASADGAKNNERLEFLGDAALDLIVAQELFTRFPELSEGALTEIKASIVSRKNLAVAGARLGLAEAVTLGRGMRSRTLPGSVLANLYEAVLGAIYLDGGYEAARQWALESLGAQIESATTLPRDGNPKQVLQEFVQRCSQGLPRYELIETRGSAHAKVFLVAAWIHEQRFPSAWGRTMKEAESWAAYEALLVLRERGELDPAAGA